ncbi:hypothetical protein [Fluviicola taffensis]|uniref:Lipoprotein n=1 Tax=Fluviicola taffensis (strain DSM 16823 / NCIMB 13979 / RW262) TaxID=755732 RepID=F2IJ33_FLUTR|nr:hypothetical protein [Fluviicola taffensis]AEA43891.1 hypothetical protein Fluta_1904 [Fluviicola taffensis DSM 16823]
MKKLFTFILFLFLLVSCGKKRTIVITATNGATGERYAGLQYFVVSSTTSGNGEKYKTEKSGFLNENGEASEIIREKQYRTYAVRVVEPENSCYNKEITMYFDGANDKNGHFDFVFAECAYLKQNIVNVNCERSTDIFNIRDRFTYSEWSGWSYDIMGCFSNTGGDYSKVPAGKRYFQWRAIRQSGVIEGLDSIELAPGEYGTISIHY